MEAEKKPWSIYKLIVILYFPALIIAVSAYTYYSLVNHKWIYDFALSKASTKLNDTLISNNTAVPKTTTIDQNTKSTLATDSTNIINEHSYVKKILKGNFAHNYGTETAILFISSENNVPSVMALYEENYNENDDLTLGSVSFIHKIELPRGADIFTSKVASRDYIVVHFPDSHEMTAQSEWYIYAENPDTDTFEKYFPTQARREFLSENPEYLKVARQPKLQVRNYHMEELYYYRETNGAKIMVRVNYHFNGDILSIESMSTETSPEG